MTAPRGIIPGKEGAVLWTILVVVLIVVLVLVLLGYR